MLTVHSASVLRDTGEDVLHQLIIGAVAKLERWRLQSCARRGNCGTEFVVDGYAAREPSDIVDHRYALRGSVFYQELDQRREARPYVVSLASSSVNIAVSGG